MSQKPSFLRNEATKSKGRPGMQNKSAIGMVMTAINQVTEAFRMLIAPEAPKQARKASASPLARGPFSDVVRGPAPPAGAVRHDNRDEDGSNDTDR